MTPERMALLARARVAVIGDVMIDEYLSGRVDRISPEAPVPVVRGVNSRRARRRRQCRRQCRRARGAGVAWSASSDPAARRRSRRCWRPRAARNSADRRSQPPHDPQDAGDLQPPADRPPRLRGQHPLDAGDRAGADRGRDPRASPIATSSCSPITARGCSGTACWRRPSRCQGRGQARRRRSQAPGLFRLSRRRSGHAQSRRTRPRLGTACGSGRRGRGGGAGGQRAIRRRPAADPLRTGHVLFPADGPAIHAPTVAREVFDVSGAGDTVVAIARGRAGRRPRDGGGDLLANHAAGVVVAKAGTATLVAGGTDRRAAPAAGRRRSCWPLRPGRSQRARAWARQGLTVGFANGCFDLIHPGHVALIRQAAAACDRLIVALNSDASVRRLKGPARPVQDSKRAGRVMGALKGVAAVVIFEEDTPRRSSRPCSPTCWSRAPITGSRTSSAPISCRRAAATCCWSRRSQGIRRRGCWRAVRGRSQTDARACRSA